MPIPCLHPHADRAPSSAQGTNTSTSSKKQFPGHAINIGLLLLSIAGISPPVSGSDFVSMQHSITQRFGHESLTLFRDWQRLMKDSLPLPDEIKLKRINDFFNQRIVFLPDQVVWGQDDYWATPLETLAKGQGDCEDFAIAKYFSLTELGIPTSKLRLVYAISEQNIKTLSFEQAHIVLSYLPAIDQEAWILDNLTTEIRHISLRQNLTPLFSFNSQGLWLNNGSQSISQLPLWQNLVRRARQEGFGTKEPKPAYKKVVQPNRR